MGYKVKTRVKVITANTTINDTDFGGWMCVNTGTAACEVNKVSLQPGEGLDFTACVPPDTHWDSPIQVVITAVGGQITLTQMVYKEEKGEESLMWLLKEWLKRQLKKK